MSKILKKWVGEEELRKTAVRNLASPWWDLHAGECFGVAQWRLDVMSETGGDFLMMAHEDVHRLIYRLAVDAGAQVQFGATVEEINPEKPRPSVRLANGEVISADIIVGADGPRSLVRETVLGEEDEPRPTGITVFGGVAPASEMVKDPELKKLVEAEEWPLIMGTNRSICAHPIEFLRRARVVAGRLPTNTLNFSNLAPVFQRMMKLVPVLHRTRDMERDDIDYWIHESERVVLLGEAAHPWVPGSTHGPSMALEDAVVFAELFRRLSSEDQIPPLCMPMKKSVWKNQEGEGEGCIKRRLLASSTRSGKRGAKQFRLAMLFAYDAYDAAAEWWLLWGRYNPTDGSTRPTSDVQFEFASQTVAYQGPS
ncbi:hypothetical protein BC629DRAFT_1596505 [Irpex lacteus]|nr:hypothetical protein BC629DRAFT_1596505 [Irpex lacteus]